MLSCHMQDNPDRANGHIFNVGNPDNEVSVKELAELMIKVAFKLVEDRLLPLFFNSRN
jgi:UDP-apiose/xylose synthase